MPNFSAFIQAFLLLVFFSSLPASVAGAKKDACTMTASISVSVPNPGVVCVGDFITISANVNGGTAPYTFSWSNGMNSQSFSAPAPFFQTLILTVTDAAGCTAITSLHIKVDVWDFYIGYSNSPICQGDTVALIIASTVTLPGTTYLWSTGETTPIIYVTSSGTYTATMSNPNVPCVATHSVTISFSPLPSPNPQIVGPGFLCPGQTATLSVNGGPFSSYLWSTGETDPTIQINMPASYTVYVENSAGCVGMDLFEVLPGNIPPPVLNGPSTLCPGQTGTIVVTNSSSYTSFLWNTGAITPGITVNSPGTYSVTVTNASGCSDTGSFTVSPGNANLTLNGVSSPVTSCSAPNGAVNLTVTPAGAYSFIWSNGANTEDISNLPSGSYTVTVTNPSGCSSSATFNVGVNTVIPVPTAVPTQETCGQSNGAVSLTVTPPGSYTFLWSNGATTQNLSNIPAGTYSVTVTGTGGCTGTTSTVVSNNSFVPAISGTASPNTLCDGSNGSVSITVSPAGNYSFNWSNGAMTQNISNLAPGTYSVTVSAGGSCQNSAGFTVGNNPIVPAPTAEITPSICSAPDGAINLTVSPAGTYLFLWSTGTTTEDLTGLFAGSYSVTVTSAATGCTTFATYLVPNNSGSFSITGVTEPVTNCSQPNGAINLSVLPSGPYVFSWSNGSTTEDLAGLPAGTFSVTVSQTGSSCTGEASFFVEEQLTFPSLSASVTPSTCGQPNGSVDLSVSPSGLYDFLWSNGSNGEDLQNITSGTYEVTVTGVNGCAASTSVGVPDTITSFTLSASPVANTSCSPANGAIDLNVYPSGNYTYLWSNGATTEDLNNIAAGSYTVTVTEGINCITSTTVEVSEDAIIPSLSPSSFLAICGENNGNIDLAIYPPGAYDFIWSTGDTVQSIQNLAPGNYSVTATGANGCTSSVSAFVGDSLVSFTASGVVLANNSCIAPDGSIGLTLSEPGNFSFLWSNGATTQDLQGLAPGAYTVTITLGLTCILPVSFEVPDESAPPVLSQVIVPALCGQNNGSIDLMATPPDGNSFLWSNGATTEDLEDIGPGIYSVTCTDADGCPAAATMEVPGENTVISLFANPFANTSCISPNGAIDLTVTAVGSFTCLWSNGAATEDISGLPSGNYSVTVTDISGCSEVLSTIVDGPAQPVVVISGPDSVCEGDSAVLYAGTGFLTYSWSTGETGESITVFQPGPYSVTATDAAGCIAVTGEDFQILAPPSPAIDGPSVICGGDAVLNVSGGNFSQINWNTGELTSSITVSQTGTYSVTVTNAEGCTAAAALFLNVGVPPFPVIVIDSSNCDGTATLYAGEGYSGYLWSTGSTSSSITVSSNGTYTVTVSDTLGCMGMADGNLVLPQLPQVTISGPEGLCQGSATTLSVPEGFSQYIWGTGETTSQISISQGGVYSVTVSDANGCTAIDEWTVIQWQTDYVFLQATTCSPQDTGIVQMTLSNQYGCDSVVVTQTVLELPVLTFIELKACEGGSVLFNGLEIPAGGSQDFIFNASNGCDSIVTVNVLTFPSVDFELAATKTCWNSADGTISVSMLSGMQPFQYALNGGTFQEVPFFTGLPGGYYSVQAEDANGCFVSGNIQVPQTIPTQVLVEDQLLSCELGEATLLPIVISGNPEDLVWTWQDGSHNPWLKVNEAGIYSVTIDDGCEVLEISARVTWETDYDQTDLFYIPNCFSPNADGINDDFRAYPGKGIEIISFEFRVFDRWGDEMFAAFNPEFGWDGFHRGVHKQPAVYVWFLKAKVLVCGVKETDVFREGGITIVK